MIVEDLLSSTGKDLKASEIRELLKLTQDPDVISFAGGLPNPLTFPIPEVKEIIDSIIEERGKVMLQYGTTEGARSLRRVLLDRLSSKDGVRADMDNIMILSGSQQGLYLLGMIMLDPGDVIITEAPTYVGAITAFRPFRPTFVTVKMDDEGMDTHLLEETVKRLKAEGKPIKFIYSIPTFQNPAGITMSLERRKHLMEIAREHDLMVVEDNPYGDLRFSGEPVPHLKALDTDDRVLYFGTFSKILAPGFRIAFAVGNAEVMKKLVLGKQAVDLCTNSFGQHVAMEYIRRGYLDKHLPKIVEFYRRKRDIMLEAMEEHFPSEAKWTRPDGGMFLWVTLPEKINTKEMFIKAVERKVAYVHGAAFFPDGSGTNTMRINFTYPTDEQIVEGIKRLASVIKEELRS